MAAAAADVEAEAAEVGTADRPSITRGWRAGRQSGIVCQDSHHTLPVHLHRLRVLTPAAAILLLVLSATVLGAQLEAPITYQVAFPTLATHTLYVTAQVPTDDRPAVEMMMATWTPGQFQAERYSKKVDSVMARSPLGVPLRVQRTRANRWLVETAGLPSFTLTYRVRADVHSPDGNWVGDSLIVLNGAPTFMTIVGGSARYAVVDLSLPPGWTSYTSLDSAQDAVPNHYQAANYDELVDSPIVAGRLQPVRFVMDGRMHVLVDAGAVGDFSGEQAGRALVRLVAQGRHFWGALPYHRYVFLNLFRPGAGDMSHASSMVVTTSAARAAQADGFDQWLTTVTRQYFQSWNGKRLRPVELGPFDYENPPRTTGLWITEGLSTYYAHLLMTRAGFTRPSDWLAHMSALIADLQSSPGRAAQTLATSSLDAWHTDSASRNIAPRATVNYRTKGAVVAMLLDAHIRALTGDSANLDDVMRRAYAEYSGAQGYTREQFQAVADTVARTDLADWFHQALDSTSELDYTEMLAWYGLTFPPASGRQQRWTLAPVDTATPEQDAHLKSVMRIDLARPGQARIPGLTPAPPSAARSPRPSARRDARPGSGH